MKYFITCPAELFTRHCFHILISIINFKLLNENRGFDYGHTYAASALLKKRGLTPIIPLLLISAN